MLKPIVFSVIESPRHPRLSGLYEELGLQELQFKSVRKTIAALKQHRPDFIIAEFFYAYSTNYSSNYICNLDSLLITLQKYPDYNPVLILLVQKNERQYIARLEAHYKIDHILTHPVDIESVKNILLEHESI